jgi:co-chaperonin GroES (HSP10)
MKITPLWHNVLVKKINRRPDNWTKILTEVDFEYDDRWIVEAIWPWATKEDWTREKIEVEVWDKIYFSKYDISRVDIDGKEHYIINASKIIAKEG